MALEAVSQQTLESVRELTKAVQRQAEITASEISSLSKEISQLGRPDPRIWMQGIAIVIALMIPFGSIVALAINNQTGKLNTAREYLESSYDTLRQDISSDIFRLRDIDALVLEQDAASRVVHAQINERLTDLFTRTEANSTEILRLRDWRLALSPNMTGLNAAQWERLRSLERAVYGEPLKAPYHNVTGVEQ